MEVNLQESADWFKLTNEIPNVKRNILCEKSLFCINFICLMTISSQGIPPLWYRARYKRHTFSAIRFSIRNYIKFVSMLIDKLSFSSAFKHFLKIFTAICFLNGEFFFLNGEFIRFTLLLNWFDTSNDVSILHFWRAILHFCINGLFELLNNK